MSTFFSSDEHFSHANILKYCSRPFKHVDEMDEELIRAHNRIVTPNDTVFHLGDFTFKPISFAFNVIRRLNGKHFFIRGNHDAWNNQTIPVPELLQSARESLGHDKLIDVKDYFEFKQEGEHLVLFHFPMFTWHKNHRGSIHLHGHCHGSIDEINRKANVKRIDVGVDSAYKLYGEYRPFRLKEVIDLANKRGIDPPDFFENVGPNKEPERG